MPLQMLAKTMGNSMAPLMQPATLLISEAAVLEGGLLLTCCYLQQVMPMVQTCHAKVVSVHDDGLAHVDISAFTAWM
jgi:hypothetical protein